MSEDRAKVVPLAGGGSSLADLAMEEVRFNWGEAYEFGIEPDGQCWARRRDGLGEAITADSPEKLPKLVAADYDMKPVPRDLPKAGRR